MCVCMQNPKIFYQWLSDKQALYIARPARLDLTAQYMNKVHHQALQFIDEPTAAADDEFAFRRVVIGKAQSID